MLAEKSSLIVWKTKKIDSGSQRETNFIFLAPGLGKKRFASNWHRDTIIINDKPLKGDYQLDPIKISMLNTNSTNKLNVVHFNKNDVSGRDLQEIKVVYHHIVKWLPFKPKRIGPTQCFRCCMYVHGIQSCNRASRLCSVDLFALCSDNHLSSSCELLFLLEMHLIDKEHLVKHWNSR